eukprot:4838466-Alexandrium_andersonii.AAC.1
MACFIMHRGNMMPQDVYAAVATIKTARTIQLVDSCPTTGSMRAKATCMRCMISNTMAIAEVMLDPTYSKHIFVHWHVGEGIKDNKKVATATTEGRDTKEDYGDEF